MNKPRRAARELALNILYQADIAGIPLDEAISTAIENASTSPEVKEYAEALARGAWKYVKETDAATSLLSPEWPPDRQPAVDRNIIRMAVYEIKYVDSVPPIVSVDEAIELAKKYSTADSSKFVNGVLAAYLRQKENVQEVKDIAGTDSQRD